MVDRKEKRIGILEYDWSLYSFVKDLAIKMGEVGYTVDIFQKDPLFNPNFASYDQIANLPNVRIINCSNVVTFTQKVFRKIRKIIGRIDKTFFLNPKNLLDPSVLRKSKKIFDESEYCCLIGIEKKGLIWAGIFAQLYNLPLIYYSLELYIEDHPGMAAALRTREFSSLRLIEKRFHQLAGATIIQDRHRADILMRYNQVESTRLLYLPISVRGSIIKEKSDFIFQNLKIDPSKKVLLYYGLIQDARFSTSLVKVARQLNDEIMLVMHGYGDPAHISSLKSIADQEKVRFSLNLVAEEEITEVISSATIGLALYQSNNSNDRLAAFSSVKVAYYMQSGIPVIAFHSESFNELMDTYKCGELIDSIDEIPLMVEKILRNYDQYREQSYQAFYKFYDFENNFQVFLEHLDDFIAHPS